MNSKVDLTAMVDLAFLLITFFMLTTTLSKPQSMNLAMPDKSEKDDVPIKVADYRSMTLLLGKDHKLMWYMGELDKPMGGPDVTTYGKEGLRKLLIEHNTEVLRRTQDIDKGLIAIIKPSDESEYRDLVDALDEMVISGIKSYAIVDISPIEVELLKSEGLN